MLIDLHGMNESEAILKLDAFLLNFEESLVEECKVITGKGIVLGPLVTDELTRCGYKWKYEDNNQGAIIVYK